MPQKVAEEKKKTYILNFTIYKKILSHAGYEEEKGGDKIAFP